MATKFNENPPSNQYEPDSVIQGADKETEEGGRKISGNRRNRRMGGRNKKKIREVEKYLV